jgi:hypothetical protein
VGPEELGQVVRPARLERAACGLGNRCSILLSYGRKTRRAGLASGTDEVITSGVACRRARSQ